MGKWFLGEFQDCNSSSPCINRRKETDRRPSSTPKINLPECISDTDELNSK